MSQQRAAFAARVPRPVPVEWVGVASEVVLMGDFDGWTRGRELPAEDLTSDSVYCRFEGTLSLRPGRYRVKLLVGGCTGAGAGWCSEVGAECRGAPPRGAITRASADRARSCERGGLMRLTSTPLPRR